LKKKIKNKQILSNFDKIIKASTKNLKWIIEIIICNNIIIIFKNYILKNKKLSLLI
jgi:hypothetical protein